MAGGPDFLGPLSCASRSLFRRNKLQQVTNTAIQNGAQSGQYVGVQPRYGALAIVIELGALHFGTMGEFVFADTSLGDQFCHLDFNMAILLQNDHHPVWKET